VPVSFVLPSAAYDRLYSAAARERVSVAEAIRRRLEPHDDDDDE
jgi:hypothetical protein